jgi:O-antigen/teichoic acid export membrane protein
VKSDADVQPAAAPPAEARLVARNVATRYLAIAVELAVGLLVLPFNVAHLGKAAYGLWILTASVTAYFSVLDLGYSGAIVKFVAHYRAKRDVRALNEILSTMWCAFSVFGVLTYAVAAVIAAFMGRLFHLGPEEAQLGRIVLLVVSANVALGTAFSVYGGVINGFQRYDRNNIVGAISSVIVAVVNVLVLAAGYGLIHLVIATTMVRILTYWAYRANAYAVFPQLRLRLQSFRRARLKEVTAFSVHLLLIDWANKVNFALDAVVIGVFLNTGAVAVWSVSQRLAETTLRLTNQLNDVLFPNVVDHDTSRRLDRLQSVFLMGTRFSLATVVPLCIVLLLLGRSLLQAWVGPSFTAEELDQGALVLQVLAITVLVRVGNATASTVLAAAGRHSLVALCNVATAAANLSLSVLLVGPLGLPGVALGTLLPVSVGAMLVLFPAGCRHLGLDVKRALATAVWPTVWPAAAMAGCVWITLSIGGPSLLSVASKAAVGIAVYATAFLAFAVSPVERRLWLAEALRWSGRPGWSATEVR